MTQPLDTTRRSPTDQASDVDVKLSTVHMEKTEVELPSTVAHLQAEAEWIATLTPEEWELENKKLVRKVGQAAMTLKLTIRLTQDFYRPCLSFWCSIISIGMLWRELQ